MCCCMPVNLVASHFTTKQIAAHSFSFFRSSLTCSLILSSFAPVSPNPGMSHIKRGENTYPAMIGITDDRGNKVLLGLAIALKSHQYFLPIIGNTDYRCISKPIIYLSDIRLVFSSRNIFDKRNNKLSL